MADSETGDPPLSADLLPAPESSGAQLGASATSHAKCAIAYNDVAERHAHLTFTK